MTEQIIIDLYSLYIQVCGIFIALVAVYSFFRLGTITDLLVGQGVALHKMQLDIQNSSQEESSITLDDKHLRRLRDAIDRKNIFGIEESLITLSIRELYAKNSNPNGYFKHILPNFIQTKKYMGRIKNISFASILLFTATIVLCVVSIVLTNQYYELYYMCIISLFIGVNLMTVFSFLCSGYLIFISIYTNVGFEENKRNVCKDLRDKNPKIDNLY